MSPRPYGKHVRLVVISIALGGPLAYYFASRWLEQYEHRVEISWAVFVITAVLALLVTLLTVSYQALSAASMSPVKTLRTE